MANGGTYDHIFWTEKFNDGMQTVLDAIETPNKVDLKTIPKFNESEGHGPKRASRGGLFRRSVDAFGL